MSVELEQDWRYSTFLKYHRGLRFRRSDYAPEQEGDDDHCIACWQKFAADFRDCTNWQEDLPPR